LQPFFLFNFQIQLKLPAMAFFIQKHIPRLFVAIDQNETNNGFVAFLIPESGTIPIGDLELSDALTNSTYNGIFVFSAQSPLLSNEEEASTFYKNIINKAPVSNRSILWAHNTRDYTNLFVDIMGINDNGSKIISGLQATIALNALLLNIPNGMSISLNGTVLEFSSSTQFITFSGSSAPIIKPVGEAIVDFSGNLLGCLKFQAYLNRGSIMINPQNPSNGMMLGFEYFFPTQKDTNQAALPAFFPFAEAAELSNDFLQFNISIDPTDPFNETFTTCAVSPCTIFDLYNLRRTYFDFTGVIFNSQNQLFLNSFYSTAFGATINLYPITKGSDVIPARLVLCLGESISNNTANFYLAPEGDYSIKIVSNAGINDNYLMCGVQGTEFFQITSQTTERTGDTIRFISGKPALAPNYPFVTASPVETPQDPKMSLMSPIYTTSWATLLPSSGNEIKYVSQPKGSSLFGNDTLIASNYNSLFGHSIPGFIFTPDNTTVFPIIPYIGSFNGDGINSFTSNQIEEYERLIISPERRTQITKLSNSSLLDGSLKINSETAVSQTITTPSGLLVSLTLIEDKMQWNNVLLGKNTDHGKDYLLQFVKPDIKLIEALQTSDLFLVVANANYINNKSASFDNSMSIDDWMLKINVGQNPGYGDYKNIMIIKAKKGKLYDPKDKTNSLVANPSKWTQKENFSAPTVLNNDGVLQNADINQLVNVSQWLQSYFEHAAQQLETAPEYFTKFNAIATDENWTGILSLRVDIKNIPTNLSGIVAGVTDESSFNAHHLAVEISPVKKEGTNASLSHPSTLFGLIYYVDPNFIDSPPYITLPPTTAERYDFCLLTLKVLFENTAVTHFESYSQLTLSALFETEVSAMGDPKNIYNNILLKGSFQMNGSNPIYNLSSEGDNLFYLNNNIIKKIEITNAVLTARNSTDATKAISWFGLSGYIDYIKLNNTITTGETTTTSPFDLFSFGNNEASDLSGKGLYFNNLGIEMIYTIDSPKDKTFSFVINEITFDTSISTPRKESLYTNFALNQVTLISGTEEATPDKLGFLTVIPDMRLTGVSGSNWYGLKMLLNMGSPGELAGKANLNAYLLLTWSPKSTGTNYKAGIAISLPGSNGSAPLISLQSVLKLSIGQIRLTYDNTKNSFLMLFTDIAIQFLGLLKIPPNGSTLFYLFGNPNANGKSSGLGWYAMYKKDAKVASKTIKAEINEELIYKIEQNELI
jgi:hypothetical protein